MYGPVIIFGWVLPPVPYTKPFVAVADQLRLLRSRGMAASDEVRARDYLARIGYYRLSGYWYPFRISEQIIGPDGRTKTLVRDTFRAGTEFRHAVELYVFDKRLRLLFLDALERLEVALRVDIALLLGERDPIAHRLPTQLHGNFVRNNPRTGQVAHTEWLRRLDDQIARSKEEFVSHFRSRYSTPLPIWVAIELWDFGMLATFFSGLRIQDRSVIAAKYGVHRYELLESWLWTLNQVRNICAHHARLWNRTLSQQPKWPRIREIPVLDHLVSDTYRQSRVYVAAAIAQLLLGTVNPQTTWSSRIVQHLTAFPNAPGISVRHMGFPDDWENLPLWN